MAHKLTGFDYNLYLDIGNFIFAVDSIIFYYGNLYSVKLVWGESCKFLFQFYTNFSQIKILHIKHYS